MTNEMISWTIFEKPKDYPNKFVTRRFVNAQPHELHYLSDSLQEARLHLPSGLMKFMRAPEDDRAIVETWL